MLMIKDNQCIEEIALSYGFKQLIINNTLIGYKRNRDEDIVIFLNGEIIAFIGGLTLLKMIKENLIIKC